MQLRISPSMRSITISSNYGVLDSMKVKVGSRPLSYRTLFYTILALAFLLPFVFILAAVVTLEGVDKCSSLDCLGRRLSPKFLGRRTGDSARLMTDLYEILNQVDTKEVPAEARLPGSFSEFLSEMNNNQYDIKAFAVFFKSKDRNSGKTIETVRETHGLYYFDENPFLYEKAYDLDSINSTSMFEHILL